LKKIKPKAEDVCRIAMESFGKDDRRFAQLVSMLFADEDWLAEILNIVEKRDS